MSAVMTAAADYLRARLDEEEAAAHEEAATGAAPGAAWGPARVLEYVAARRRVLDICCAADGRDIHIDTWSLAKTIVLALVQPYRGRPDFNDAWTLPEQAVRVPFQGPVRALQPSMP